MSKKYESEIQRLLRSKQFPHSSKKSSWPDQFKDATNVNNGDIDNASLANHVAHSLSFLWKVMAVCCLIFLGDFYLLYILYFNCLRFCSQ